MLRALKCPAIAIVMAAAVVGVGQHPSVIAAESPSSPGRSEIEAAWSKKKFAYVLFHKESDAAVSNMRRTFAGTRDVAGSASLVEIAVNDAREADLVAEYDLSRAPMPLLVAMAPNGAVTGAWPLQVTSEQLEEGMVSSGAAECLKSLQDGRVVIVCVQNEKSPHGADALNAAKTCQADERFGDAIDVVTVDPTDAKEKSFLKSLDVKGNDAVTVILAPPGRALGRFDGAVTGEKLVAAITSAQAGCCPDGKCGPNGCCPGGKCAPAE